MEQWQETRRRGGRPVPSSTLQISPCQRHQLGRLLHLPTTVEYILRLFFEGGYLAEL